MRWLDGSGVICGERGIILILTSDDDVHASAVETLLRDQGVQFVVWDPGSFPSTSRIVMNARRQGLETAVLLQDGQAVCASHVTSVWYRRPSQIIPPVGIDTGVAELIKRDADALLQNLYGCFNCRWVPGPPWVLETASRKITALVMACRFGFTIPETVATNDPDTVCDIYNEFEGCIISKRVGAPLPKTLQDDFVRYTELVTTNDINAVSHVQYCPAIFQRYIEKLVELRVTVVGSQVFAAEIGSQATAHTRYDWRKFDDYGTPYRSHNLPDKVRAQCVQLTHALGLNFSAIDLILDARGNYVFIELNPNGQYLWIQDLTGLPISNAIADLLIAAQ